MFDHIQATRDWFRNYKVPTGKPKNSFAFDEQYKDEVGSATLWALAYLILGNSTSSSFHVRNLLVK